LFRPNLRSGGHEPLRCCSPISGFAITLSIALPLLRPREARNGRAFAPPGVLQALLRKSPIGRRAATRTVPQRRETRDVNGQGARVVKRGQPIEKLRTIKVTAIVTADQIRHPATVGAFEIVAVENKRDGTPKAFTVKETQYRESDAAFLKRVLGGRKGRSSAILVLNDEAHHAYRRGALEDGDPYGEDDETTEANVREATVWIEGLDRIKQGTRWTRERHPTVRGPFGNAVLHPR
jgi:hypothetical protein